MRAEPIWRVVHILNGIAMIAAAAMGAALRKQPEYKVLAVSVVMGALGIALILIECFPTRSGRFCARYMSTLNTHLGRGILSLVCAFLLFDIPPQPPKEQFYKKLGKSSHHKIAKRHKGQTVHVAAQAEGPPTPMVLAFRTPPKFMMKECLLWALCAIVFIFGVAQLVVSFLNKPVSRSMDPSAAEPRIAPDKDFEPQLVGAKPSGSSRTSSHEPTSNKRERNELEPARPYATRNSPVPSEQLPSIRMGEFRRPLASSLTSLSLTEQAPQFRDGHSAEEGVLLFPQPPALPPLPPAPRFHQQDRPTTARSQSSVQSVSVPGIGVLDISSESEDHEAIEAPRSGKIGSRPRSSRLPGAAADGHASSLTGERRMQ